MKKKNFECWPLINLLASLWYSSLSTSGSGPGKELGHHPGNSLSNWSLKFLFRPLETLSRFPLSGDKGLSKTLNLSNSFLVPTTTSRPPKLLSRLTTTLVLSFSNRNRDPISTPNFNKTLKANTTTKLTTTKPPTNSTVERRQETTIFRFSSKVIRVRRSL